MARRHEDWNVGLAEDLRDPEFAREFLLGAIDEEVPLQVALGKVVRAMGVKEFAAKVGMASSNLLRTLKSHSKPDIRASFASLSNTTGLASRRWASSHVSSGVGISAWTSNMTPKSVDVLKAGSAKTSAK